MITLQKSKTRMYPFNFNFRVNDSTLNFIPKRTSRVKILINKRCDSDVVDIFDVNPNICGCTFKKKIYTKYFQKLSIKLFLRSFLYSWTGSSY